jgi:hypothetical protein
VAASDLKEIVEHYHAAVDAFVTGDPEPQKKLWSRREDVTLANPLDPPARGWIESRRLWTGLLPSSARASQAATTQSPNMRPPTWHTTLRSNTRGRNSEPQPDRIDANGSA